MTIVQLVLLGIVLLFHSFRRSLLSSIAVIIACFTVGFNLPLAMGPSERGWCIAVLIIFALVGLWGLYEAREVA